MGHKRNKKPQTRHRQKKTTGQLEFTDVVYIEKEKIDGKDNMYATCTCGKWRSSPEAKTFTAIGREAKAHVVESGHRFRHHEVEPEDNSDDPLAVLNEISLDRPTDEPA